MVIRLLEQSIESRNRVVTYMIFVIKNQWIEWSKGQKVSKCLCDTIFPTYAKHIPVIGIILSEILRLVVAIIVAYPFPKALTIVKASYKEQ